MQNLTVVIRGHCKYLLSIFSTAMYSPWDNLNIFFFLSIIFMAPFGCHSPISPAMISKSYLNILHLEIIMWQLVKETRKKIWRDFHKSSQYTCMKPTINHNLLSKIFSLVIAREQWISSQTNFAAGITGKCIISHLRYRFKPGLNGCHGNSNCSHHRKHIADRCKTPSTTFSKTCHTKKW